MGQKKDRSINSKMAQVYNIKVEAMGMRVDAMGLRSYESIVKVKDDMLMANERVIEDLRAVNTEIIGTMERSSHKKSKEKEDLSRRG